MHINNNNFGGLIHILHMWLAENQELHDLTVDQLYSMQRALCNMPFSTLKADMEKMGFNVECKKGDE